MSKWMTGKQKEYANIVKMTEGKSPFAMQMFIGTYPTSNQLQEFNVMMKPLGKKLTKKGHNYSWK